jgi:hypothetical protein
LSSTRDIIKNLGNSPLSLPPETLKPSQEDIQSVIELLTTLVCDPNEMSNENYRLFRTLSIAKLSNLFTILKDSLPYQQSTLNVVSLGCGTPDDFLALKLFLKKHNPTCVMNYVGLEVDSQLINKMVTEYQNYSNIKLITADATDLASIKERLTSANVLPEKGFDIILLRHPEILSLTQGPLFERMLFSTIPFLSHDQSTVFVSAFDFLESLLIKSFFNLSCYSAFTEFNWNNVVSRRNVFDKPMEPESNSFILKCSGFSLNLQNEIIKNQVFHDIIRVESNPSFTNYILKIINFGEYQKAFLFACSICHVGFLKVLLDHKEELGIDMYAVSDKNSNLALQLIRESAAPAQVKLEALDLIAQHNSDNNTVTTSYRKT